MAEIDNIRDQLKRAFEKGAWHGPAVLEVLEGVTAAQAAGRPIRAAHSIGEIVRHMATWKRVVTRRLGGHPVRDVPPNVDWPPGPSNPREWQASLRELRRAHSALVAAAARSRGRPLHRPPAGGTSTRYVLLHGVIQHDLYHAGQIAVLKKS